MLIAFEGQDGAGKTSLLHATFLALERQGLPVVAVPEFSLSPIGLRLLDALANDKFLRSLPGDESTAITRALDIVADLYHFDERVIGPAMDAGCIVLKDRHVGSILSTLVPTLVDVGAIGTESAALAWLGGLLSELHHVPAATVYVDAPLDVRLRRIRGRERHLVEARATEVDGRDLAVFAARDRLMRQFIADTPSEFLTVDNGFKPLSEGVNSVLALIDTRRASTSPKGE
jgi:thymidylate kinase